MIFASYNGLGGTPFSSNSGPVDAAGHLTAGVPYSHVLGRALGELARLTTPQVVQLVGSRPLPRGLR